MPLVKAEPVPRRRRPPPGPTPDERTNHELTHVVYRSWRRHCVAARAKDDPRRRTERVEGEVPKVMLDYRFFASNAMLGVQLPVLIINDVSTGAVASAQTRKEASTATINTIVQCIETWGHSEIVL